jgi:hypothetical protein
MAQRCPTRKEDHEIAFPSQVVLAGRSIAADNAEKKLLALLSRKDGCMLRPRSLALALCGCLCGASPVRAHHFTIDLEVQSGKARKTTHAQTLQLGEKARPRLILEIKAGSEVTVKWKLTSTAAMTTYKNVLVHFFVVKQKMLGQEFPPKLDKGVIVESAQTIDFKPKESTEGQLNFTIPKEGAYLVRLETIGAAVGKDGHEHFAALDLKVR